MNVGYPRILLSRGIYVGIIYGELYVSEQNLVSDSGGKGDYLLSDLYQEYFGGPVYNHNDGEYMDLFWIHDHVNYGLVGEGP